MTVLFCKKCTISNYRPSSCVEFRNNNKNKTYIEFDNEICSACKVHEGKNNTDWTERENLLISLLNSIKSDDKIYDIIIPGSGGKDSMYASYILKNINNMKCLSVTWAPHIYSTPGFKNLETMIHSIGIDNIVFTPNGKVHRLLTQLAFKNLLHPFQPFILGQKNIAIKMAVLYNINTIFYGENEAEYGNNIDDMKIPYRKLDYCIVNDDENMNDFIISGVKVSTLISEYGLSMNDLEPYLPIKKSKLLGKDIKIYYLSYFYNWDPQNVFYEMARKCDFKTNDHRTEGSYCKYSSFDDRTDGYHYYTTWIKFGLGRASYDSSQEIRNNKISLDEGKSLVKKYDGEFPIRFFLEFLDYTDMKFEEFFYYIDKHRNNDLWEKLENNKWKLKYTCYGEEKIDNNYNIVKEYIEKNCNNDYLIRYRPLN